MELAESAGLVLDPWQAHAVDIALRERADGKWASFEVGILVARQNGKGGILEALELAGLFLLGEKLILHSAHEFKTAAEAFLRVKSLIDNTDDLRKRVARVRTSHGDEGIELMNGARLRFVARSRSSGRGFSGDRIVMDEAQELPRSAMGALLPTLSARPNPQVIYTGTSPEEGNNSEHFESVRERGRKGTDPGLAWLEWTPDLGEDDDVEVDLDDREVWAQCNPALGYRITEETIQRERNSLGDDQFARERLSVWRSSATDSVVDLNGWDKLEGVETARPKPVVFSVEVSPDRRWTSIGLAGLRSDGARHVQIVQSGKGTGWVVERMVELVKEWKSLAVVVDPASPAGSLIPALMEAGIEPVSITGREMGQACGVFVDAVTEKTLHHQGQPLVRIALSAARKRNVGDYWVWHNRDSKTDISPLRAVTLALFGLVRAMAKPEKKRSGVVV